jgi:DNA-binding CsgD family transcriptional regulator
VSEREVLKVLAEGTSLKEIAYDLNPSVETVEAHNFNLMCKLDIQNAAHLVQCAVQKKLIKVANLAMSSVTAGSLAGWGVPTVSMEQYLETKPALRPRTGLGIVNDFMADARGGVYFRLPAPRAAECSTPTPMA